MTQLNQPSFAAGELSPAMTGRIDLAKYQTGLATCRNFIVESYGGVVNRPGTVFCCETAGNTKEFLLPFKWGDGQMYILCLGNYTMRIVKNGGLLTNAGTAIQISTPWSINDVFDIHWAQSADVITVVHRKYPPKQIKRYSETSWAIEDYTPTFGPFEDINIDESKTIASSGTTGSVTLTSNFDIFSSTDVGREVYLEAKDLENYKSWQNGVEVALNSYVVSNSKVYKAIQLSSGTCRTGGTAPDHEEGSAWDGSGTVTGSYSYGVKWQYICGLIGTARITAVSDNRTATATVTRQIISDAGDGSGGMSTYKWAMSVWCSKNGYPGAVNYFQQRMVFAGSTQYPQTIWMTKTGSYTDFSYNLPTLDDDSITVTMASSQVNPVRNILSLRSLLMMTSSSEWSVADTDNVVSPSTINIKCQSYRGSSILPPLTVGNMALVVSSKGGHIRDVGYEWASDSFNGNDLSVLAEHLFTGHTIVDWEFAQEPYSIAWCVRDDGALIGLTYLREHEVFAWHRHDTDGQFESIGTIEENGEDRVYVCVKRKVNNVDKHYIEYFAKRDGATLEDGIFLDSSLSSVDTTAHTSYSGLNHLEGKTVGIIADGNVHPDKVVTNGSVTLNYPAKVVRIGLKYTSDLETLRLSGADGSLFGKNALISSVKILARDTRSVFAGTDFDHLWEIKQRSNERYGDPIALKTGWFDVAVDSTWGRDAHIAIRQTNPLPITVLAICPEVKPGGR